MSFHQIEGPFRLSCVFFVSARVLLPPPHHTHTHTRTPNPPTSLPPSLFISFSPPVFFHPSQKYTHTHKITHTHREGCHHPLLLLSSPPPSHSFFPPPPPPSSSFSSSFSFLFFLLMQLPNSSLHFVGAPTQTPVPLAPTHNVMMPRPTGRSSINSASLRIGACSAG